MEFLIWHYTQGFDLYLKRWLFYLRWIFRYFSLTLLLKTLFSPWKRLVEEDTSPGFNLSRYFETLTFNAISRAIGAIVRIILFFSGLVFLFFSFFAGAFGVIFWVILPILGLPSYLRFKKQPKQFMQTLFYKIKKGLKNPLEIIFNSNPGKFFLDHTTITYEELLKNSKLDNKFFDNYQADSFSELILKLVKKKTWTQEFLQKHTLSEDDLSLVSFWWDKIKSEEFSEKGESFGRPGIGLELLFGYTPNLNQYSIDLGLPQEWSHRLIGREEIVLQMERALTSGNSVVLVGSPGVGKKTVVYEFAHRARYGQLGQNMAYRRVLEFDYNFLFSESSDLNTKKAKLSLILLEASYAGNIILMIRDIHRLTNPEVEGYDFTDVFEEYMEKKELKVIAISTPRDYERFIAPNLRLRKHLKNIEIKPPTKKEAMEILIDAAIRWETIKGMTIPITVLRKILDESDRYITEVPFPEKVLELLDAVVYYKEQIGGKTINLDDANKVLEEKTGISFTHLTQKEKKLLGKLEEVIHKRLVNQDVAVDLIAKSLRGRTVGVKKENRPVGSFLFMGPTGVGKTETAKVLAKVYYGNEENILRYDIAEYAGREGLETLIGSVSSNQPGILTTSIKNRPASLLLLDEIEKASSEIYNLFLALLDEGVITDAFGRKINCQHLFIIATSNAGAEYIRQQVLKGVSKEDLQNNVVNYVLEKGIFSPEFLNRFDGVVVYEPLKQDDLVKIAKILLLEMAANLKKQNINLEINNETAQKVAEEGYDPAFGARPMRRIIDLVLGDLFGKAILTDQIKPGDSVRIILGEGKDEYQWEKVSNK